MRPLLVCACLAMASLPLPADTSAWWPSATTHRVPLTVTTGPVAPDAGYRGYTVRAVLDTRSWVTESIVADDCSDLRVVRREPSGWRELHRLVSGCGTEDTQVVFPLAADLPPSSADRSYWLYLGHEAGPGGADPMPEPALSDPTRVYPWWDTGEADRLADYDRPAIRGRTDRPAQGTIRHVAGEGYRYVVGDDRYIALGIPVVERDALVAVRLRHEDCEPLNIRDALMLRTATDAEDLGEAYTATRAALARCGGGYSDDGSLRRGERLLASPERTPPGIGEGPHSFALAVFGEDPVRLRGWDGDFDPAWPEPEALLVEATDAGERRNTAAGGAAVVLSQDRGSLEAVLVRRFVEPEPVVRSGRPGPRFIDRARAIHGPGAGSEDALSCRSSGSTVGHRMRLHDPESFPLVTERGFSLRLQAIRTTDCDGCLLFAVVDGAGTRLRLSRRSGALVLEAGERAMHLPEPGPIGTLDIVYRPGEMAVFADGRLLRRAASMLTPDAVLQPSAGPGRVPPFRPLVMSAYPASPAELDSLVPEACNRPRTSGDSGR